MSGDCSGNFSKMDEARENPTPSTEQSPQPAHPEYGLAGAVSLSPLEALVRRIFIGPDGLRAGWRLLLYAAMGVAIMLLFGRLLHHLRPHISGRLWLLMVGESQLLLVVLLPAFIMARIEKRSFDAYGLPPRSAFGKLFWVGAIWGIVALTILMLAMRGTGVFYFGGLALHGVRILKFAGYWGVFFLVVGFFEEFLLRGYTQFTLTQGIGFWPAAVLLSIAFGAIHLGNEGEAWIGAFAAGVIGLFFCLTLRRTGNLWFAVGFHASWDWGETYLYSVPNSGMVEPGHLLSSSFHGSRWLTGGSVGPEGSVLVFVILFLLWVAFERVYPDAKYGVRGKRELTTAN